MTSLFSPRHRNFKYRLFLALSLLAIVPLGLALKFYPGPGREWVNNSFGGVPYNIFWMLLLAFLVPKLSPKWNAWIVFVVICAVEFLQLWHPPFLEAIRATLMGRLVLGTFFTWSDFPYYAIGCLAGWWWLRFLQHQALRSHLNRAIASEESEGNH